MTLKEKLEVEIMHLPLTDDVINAIGIELEQIADEFAIEFAEWFINSWCLHSLSYGDITIKQSLEIFKKEKGL